jgi:hypothetical protein
MSAATYRILVPGPYWPETGQAQMTCRMSLAASGVSSVLLSSVDEWDIAGITRHGIAQRSMLVRI